MAVEPESPGEVPKSIRPLPHDLDAALRAACTNVIRNNKPSHEYHKGGKAQLDYATIRRGGGNNPAPAPRRQEQAPVSLSKSPSNEDRTNRNSTYPPGVMGPDRSQRMSHISASAERQQQTEDGGCQVRVQRSRAQSRADQLMAGSPPKAPDVQRERTDSNHSRSQSTPQNSWTFPAPKLGSIRRPKPAPRAHSMETPAVPPSAVRHSWSANKTPAEGAPALSEAPTLPLPTTAEAKEDFDADWMREDSERHRLLQQQVFAETALSRHTTWVPKPEQNKDAESKETEQELRVPPAAAAVVPERKPVPSSNLVASPEPESDPASPAVESLPEDTNSVDSELVAQDEVIQAPSEQRSESRNGRGRTRGTGVPVNSRAVSRARSITREVKDFMRNASRNASRTRQPRAKVDKVEKPDDASTRSRRPSMSRTRDATRDVANNVKDYFRPGTGAGKKSLDVPRNAAHLKSKSNESFISARSDASPAKDTPMQQSQRSSRHHKNPSVSTGKNSFETDGDERITLQDNLSSDTLQQKRQVDLNRALPPLPRLDSWHHDSLASPAPESVGPPSPLPEIEPIRAPQGSGLPSPTMTKEATLKKITSRESKSPLPSPKTGGVHDYVALRMGAPVSRQSSKAKVRNPNLTQQHQRPQVGSRVQTDARHSRIPHLSDYGFPTSSSQTKKDEIAAARRRSRSMQDVNPPDLSEKLRKASANAPDGRPIHAVGQAKLVDTSARGQLDGLAGKISRKLSTKRARNITPTQAPPAPPPHRELPQRKAKTASSTPHGLSRANSTYHAQSRTSLSRKMSLEEYGEMYDNRYHKNNSGVLAPPPAAAMASSKTSPRMGLGNFLPSKFQQQQQQQHSQNSQQQSGLKKWWHLGLGNANDTMDSPSRSGTSMEQSNGGLGVRY